MLTDIKLKSSDFHKESSKDPSIVKQLQNIESDLNEKEIASLAATFQTPEFNNQCQQEQFYTLCRSLHVWIKEQKTPCFLLPKLSAIISAINELKILESPFRFSNFEMWLILFSDLSDSEKQAVRNKISGISMPRQAYQLLYPIEPGKYHSGAHTTCAHHSPDLDTSVTSFWGWLDSFNAQIGEGMHLWNLPGGLLGKSDSFIFEKMLGKKGLENIAKARTSLCPLAIDLIDRNCMRLCTGDAHLSKITFSHYEDAIIIVDHQGYFLGQWHKKDLARVEAIFSLLSQTFTWIQRELFSKLVALFANKNPTEADYDTLLKELLSLRPCDSALSHLCAPKELLEATFMRLFQLNQADFSLADLASACEEKKHIFTSTTLQEALTSLNTEKLFQASTGLVKERYEVFGFIQKISTKLETSLRDLQLWCDRIEVGLMIKEDILQIKSHSISVKAELGEVEQALQKLNWICAVYPEKNGRMIPVGVITKEKLAKRCLGTAALRDFSSNQEMEISKRIDVISIVDHHKCHIHSHFAPVAHISNTQACSTLVAELKNALLTQGEKIATKDNLATWISPERIFLQNMSLTLALLDDTDSLKKAGFRDLEAFSSLINEMLSLNSTTAKLIPSHAEKETILHHPQVKELFQLIDQTRAAVLETEIVSAAQASGDHEPSLFRDTKIQNNCARVGQIKLLTQVSEHFAKYKHDLRSTWAARARQLCRSQRNLSLHLQMISTLLKDGEEAPAQDELWIWCDQSERGYEHMTHFLRGFRLSEAIQKELAWLKSNPNDTGALTVTIHASKEAVKPLMDVVCVNFMKCASRVNILDSQEAYITISYRPGTINSRKSLISPYLP